MPVAKSATGPRPSASRSPRNELLPPDVSIDASFREYRAAAARLIEEVSDRIDPAGGKVDLDPVDVRLVRSVFGKWSTELLLGLHATPTAGFEDLRRSLPDISARVLSIKLKELEENGMIRREIIDARPPRVRYSLTERGWTVAWLARPIYLYLKARPPGSPSGTEPLSSGPVSSQWGRGVTISAPTVPSRGPSVGNPAGSPPVRYAHPGPENRFAPGSAGRGVKLALDPDHASSFDNPAPEIQTRLHSRTLARGTTLPAPETE
jgi:DNA-binding HxlR family transcriptional regulator